MVRTPAGRAVGERSGAGMVGPGVRWEGRDKCGEFEKEADLYPVFML